VGFEKGVDVMQAFSVLPDPQTNGGILIAVDPSAANEVQQVFADFGLAHFSEPIGILTQATEKRITVTL
jgi:selenide,water dikinase